MPVLLKTEGRGIDTLGDVLTALLLALAELSTYSIGKRKPDRKDSDDCGASNILHVSGENAV